MSTDRGRRPTVRSGSKRKPASSATEGVRLADGVRLVRAGTKNELFALMHADGKVQLNETAVAILRLCDGSRDRNAIIEEILRRSGGATLAADIGEFLDAARSRGWIVEP